jgi:hypothetical protein
VAPPREGVALRAKAQFFPEPERRDDPRLLQLCALRVTRRLSAQDIDDIYPGWLTKFYS